MMKASIDLLNDVCCYCDMQVNSCVTADIDIQGITAGRDSRVGSLPRLGGRRGRDQPAVSG